MIGNSYHSRGASTYAKKAIRHRRSVFIALVVAFCLGSAGQTAPVQAAPRVADTIINFNMDVTQLPNPICVFAGYWVDINTRVERTANLNGSPLRLTGGLGTPEILIKASSSDDSIASWVRDEFTIPPLAGGIVTGHNYIGLKAHKDGQVILSLWPSLKNAAANGSDVIYPAIEQQITVKKCIYNVVMRFNWNMAVDGFSAFAMGIADIDIVPDENTGKFEGAGVFDFLDGISLPGTDCSISLSGHHNKMHITGTLVDDTLKLEFKYYPADNYITGQCGDMSGSASRSFDPTISAPEGATFPSFGGTINRLTADTNPNGRLQIVVKQIVE